MGSRFISRIDSKVKKIGELFVGYNESVGYVYVAGEYLYMRASLRESILVNGKLNCIARLDGGVTIWD